jgi:TRAP-type C4-dicarboxylate transport system substrate-binding protein
MSTLKSRSSRQKSLFKPREQYKPLSRGQLDMTVFPLSYAGGQQPAYNLTLMPGLVKNHDHAARLNESPFMGKIEEIMAGDDVMVLVHGYLAGGFVGKNKCITSPDDVKGEQTRAAGKAFEQMLAGAGASIASMASSEIYNAMQSGVLTLRTRRPHRSSVLSDLRAGQVLHPGRRLCAVVHVSAAFDEQVGL